MVEKDIRPYDVREAVSVLDARGGKPHEGGSHVYALGRP
jgi:hypothetical protein